MTKRSEEDKVFINHLKTAFFWISESIDFLEIPNPKRGGLRNVRLTNFRVAFMKPIQQA